MADVSMAPAADMFEMGVQLQVLKRGTLFPMQARNCMSFTAITNRLKRSPCRKGKTGKTDLPEKSGRGLVRNRVLFQVQGSASNRTGHESSQTADGPHLPLVPGTLLTLVEPWRSRKGNGLPDLVRSCHGSFQRLGQRFLPGRALKPPGCGHCRKPDAGRRISFPSSTAENTGHPSPFHSLFHFTPVPSA